MVSNIFQSKEVISSYDFVDILSGTGIQTFYGGEVMFMSGSVLVSGMILSDKPFYSEHITTKSSSNSATFAKRVDKNFDLNFNTTRTVNGDVVVSLPIGMNSLGGLIAAQIYCDMFIYHVGTDGTNTLLVSGMTLTFNPPSTANTDNPFSRIETLKMNVTNQVFKKDEKLRLKIVEYAHNTGANVQLFGIAHDPQNREDNNEGLAVVASTDGTIIENVNTGTPNYSFATDTIMTVDIPFKLDVEI